MLGMALLLILPVLAFAAPTELGLNSNDIKSGFLPDSAVSGNNVVVPAGQNVKGPGFFAGGNVRILGNIDGTTFVAGHDVTVDGTINGDLFVAGRRVKINGKVTGNVYGAGEDLRINGTVSGDVFGAGQDVEVEESASFGRDGMLAGETITFSGQAGRQLFAGGEKVVLQGIVHDHVKLYAENLTVQDGAVVEGNLTYSSPNKGTISGQARISGKTEWKKVVPSSERKQATWQGDLLEILWSLTAALLVWFIVRVWRPHIWAETAQIISEQPLKTLGMGALALILAPILAIILMITVIGIPLGIMLGLVYGASIYLAKIIVAVFLGSWLARKFSWPEIHQGVWLVLLGLAIYTVLVKLPMVGFLAVLLTIFAGLGSIVLAFGKPKKAIAETEI